MFRGPEFNEMLLNKNACLNNVYKAMRKGDLSEVVIAALDVISKTECFPKFHIELKSELESNKFRELGNCAYTDKKYNEALSFYNKALKYAPKKSKALKLAYSSRSELFMTVKAFSACINDIETVIELGCPPEIREMLARRHEEAGRFERNMSPDNSWSNIPKFAYDYFKLYYDPKNPQIPSATRNVGVIVENNIPKMVALHDVQVGTVLALEPAFVNHLVPENEDFACYNCHKMGLNLMPCDGCCYALFCDDICMSECWKQYHSVECKLMDLINTLGCDVSLRLALKAVIKMKSLSHSWKRLIIGSNDYGITRIKNSSVSEIYNQSRTFSLLTFKDDRHLIHGAMYNHSFTLAVIIYYLNRLTNFFPSTNKRTEAMKCFGRITLYLSLFGNPTMVANAVSMNNQPQIELHSEHNYGFFSFTGKLRNSCFPNVLIAGLNKHVGLVAVQPITKGTELTVAYMGHWLDHEKEELSIRRKDMFMMYQMVCNCVICTDECQLKPDKLTLEQKECYDKVRLNETINCRNLQKVYKDSCTAITALHDVRFSQEYRNVYGLLRTCLLHLQYVCCENIAFAQIPETAQ